MSPLLGKIAFLLCFPSIKFTLSFVSKISSTVRKFCVYNKLNDKKIPPPQYKQIFSINFLKKLKFP